MKFVDKMIIKVFKILGVLAIFTSIAVYLIAKTYCIDYEAYGIIEKDLISISITLIIASILFLVLSFVFKENARNNLPIIKLSEDGFIDNGPMETGLIPWSNIEKFTIYEVMNGYNSRKYLGVWVKDLGILCSGVSATKAELIKANAASGAPPVVIPQTLIREDLNKVIEKIMLYKKEVSYRSR